MRTRLVGVAILVGVLATAGLAGAANGKSRIVVEAFSESYTLSVDCSAFGDFGFENEVEGTWRGRITDVFGSDGQLVETIFQTVFFETDTNSVTGKSLPLRGAVTETWDYTASTRTLAGKVYLGTDQGRGTYVQDTGRITITLDTGEATFVAGPHEAFFGGLDEIVCAALARE